MLKPKIKLTDEIRNFIIEERLMSESSMEFFKPVVGKTRAWLSQVESGRTANITRHDLINMMCYFRDCPNKDEVEKYIESKLNSDVINPNPYPYKPLDFMDNNEDFFATSMTVILFFHQLILQNPNEKKYQDILSTLAYNLTNVPVETLDILSYDLTFLNNLEENDSVNFLSEIKNVFVKYQSKNKE